MHDTEKEEYKECSQMVMSERTQMPVTDGRPSWRQETDKGGQDVQAPIFPTMETIIIGEKYMIAGWVVRDQHPLDTLGATKQTMAELIKML